MAQRLIGRIDDDLSHDGRNAPWALGATQRVVDGLLHHVADPSRSRRHQYAERQRTGFVARDLVSHELIADLRAVTVNHANVPACERELDDRRETLARMAELVINGGRLA